MLTIAHLLELVEGLEQIANDPMEISKDGARLLLNKYLEYLRER